MPHLDVSDLDVCHIHLRQVMRFDFSHSVSSRPSKPFDKKRQDVLNKELRKEAVRSLPPPAQGRPVRQLALVEENNPDSRKYGVTVVRRESLGLTAVGTSGRNLRLLKASRGQHTGTLPLFVSGFSCIQCQFRVVCGRSRINHIAVSCHLVHSRVIFIMSD
jgi:hypothetical protein